MGAARPGRPRTSINIGQQSRSADLNVLAWRPHCGRVQPALRQCVPLWTEARHWKLGPGGAAKRDVETPALHVGGDAMRNQVYEAMFRQKLVVPSAQGGARVSVSVAD